MTPREIFEFYRAKGWSPQAAAALAGGAATESGGNPNARGDGGKAHGIYQWHPDRQQNLIRFASQRGLNPAEAKTQLDFHHWELTQGPEQKWGEQLRNAPDIRSAAAAHISTMRPAGWTANNPMGGLGFSNRYSTAASLLGQRPEQGDTGAGTGMDSPKERGLLDTSGTGLLGQDMAYTAKLNEQQKTAQTLGALAQFAQAQQKRRQESMDAPLPKFNDGLLYTPQRGLI